jgi:hypothetical protein
MEAPFFIFYFFIFAHYDYKIHKVIFKPLNRKERWFNSSVLLIMKKMQLSNCCVEFMISLQVVTLRENKEAFNRLKLMPRIRGRSVSIFGRIMQTMQTENEKISSYQKLLCSAKKSLLQYVLHLLPHKGWPIMTESVPRHHLNAAL